MDFNDRIAAKAAHDIWAHWMKYQFTKCQFTPDGESVIPFENVARWQRQMLTEFNDLSPQEQKSDFEIADQFIKPLLREMAQALSEARAENEALKGQFLDHAETDSYQRMVKYAAHVKNLYRWEKEQKESAQTEIKRLREGIDRALAVLTVDRICYHFAQRSGSEEKRKLGQAVIDAIEILTEENE